MRIDLAVRLVEERARLQYSQADFAQKVGVSREGLRLYEGGQRGMAAEFLAEAAELGIDVQYVLTGKKSLNVAGIAPPPSNVMHANDFSGNYVAQVNEGAVVNQIHTQRHITKTFADVRPGPTHISDGQAAELKALVDKVVEAEKNSGTKPRSHASVWAALNAHCRVPKYRLIAVEDFDKAKTYLLKWIGRVNAAEEAQSDSWRKRKYAYIKINTRGVQEGQNFHAYLAEKFGGRGLSELTDIELAQAYKYLAGRRSRVKHDE